MHEYELSLSDNYNNQQASAQARTLLVAPLGSSATSGTPALARTCMTHIHDIDKMLSGSDVMKCCKEHVELSCCQLHCTAAALYSKTPALAHTCSMREYYIEVGCHAVTYW